MKLKVLMIAMTLAVLIFLAGIACAANSDRFVDGNPGASTPTPQGKDEIKGGVNSDESVGGGTTNPTEKAEINDKKAVDENQGVDTKTPAENRVK